MHAPKRYPNAGFIAILVALVALAAGRVIATYAVFSNTIDEPFHIAAGVEWIERGTFEFEGEHPPLGRIAAAAGPYLSGIRLNGQQHFGIAARQLLYQNDAYLHTLVLARLGMLVFFLLAIAGVLVWTIQLYGWAAALIAVALFTTTPTVLAHAGLATTDIPLVGTLIWAVFTLARFLERPTIVRGAAVGLATGLAFVSKISALLFVPAAAVTLLVTAWLFTRGHANDPETEPRRRVWFSLITAAVVSGLVVWSVYRFTIERRLGSFIAGGVMLPAPAFFEAIGAVAIHQTVGHAGYLLGEFRTTGWWYFFPLVVLLKTPIPLVVLTGIGAVASIRHARKTGDWQAVAPIAVALALVLVSMRASINLGVRHVLPIYPLLAMTAAYGALWLWNRSRGQLAARGLAAGLILWQGVSSALVHPDYLPYFNELAGRRPERLVLDSDLDWGQDLLRLADTIRVRRIPAVSVAYFGTADLPRLIPTDVRVLSPGEHVTGWIAASETFLSNPNPAYAGYKWLNGLTPTVRVGRSIKLFYVAPEPNESGIDAQRLSR